MGRPYDHVMQPGECLVCRKHEAADPEIEVARDALVHVGHHPAGVDTYRGHLFVEPLRHAPGLADLTDDEAAALGVAVTRAARALRRAGAEHVYSCVVGHSVPHLHVHLLPRWPGTPPEHQGLGVTSWPDAPRVDRAGVRHLVAALRKGYASKPASKSSSQATSEG